MEFTIDGNKYQIRDSEELIAVAKVTGSHFFDRSTMKSFKSKLEPRIFEAPEGVYFVTSEKFELVFSDHKEPRKWTVRLFDLDGRIRTVKVNNGEENGWYGFQKFNSRDQAYRYVEKNLTKKVEE